MSLLLLVALVAAATTVGSLAAGVFLAVRLRSHSHSRSAQHRRPGSGSTLDG